MELVAGGVEGGDDEGYERRAPRVHARPQGPQPEQREQRVLDDVRELTQDRVGHPEAAVQVGLRREEEDHAHQDEGRQPRVQAAKQRHGHTVESVGVLVITSKSPYAIRALAELARRGGGAPVPIGEIARARDIPVQFLEGLFARSAAAASSRASAA